jgi:ubiquinone/menaquinone biosynthesis C-methylase UbiE
MKTTVSIGPSTTTPPDILPILGKLGQISAGQVLDVATGEGVFIRFLMKALQTYDHFVGVDNSEKKLSKARATSKRGITEFILMNVESLEFSDATFDTVCIADSLHHLENANQILSEMRCILKPGGTLFLQEMYSDRDQSGAQNNEIAIHTFAAEIDTLGGRYHHRPYTRNEIQSMVAAAGFEKPDLLTSSWPTKCAFCKYIEHCSEPLRPGKINAGYQVIRNSLNTIKEHPSYLEYRNKAKELRKQLREHGYREASIVFLIAKKR